MVTVRGFVAAEDIAIVAIEAPTAIESSPGVETTQDISVNYVQASISDNGVRLRIIDGQLNTVRSSVNDTPAVASIDAEGDVLRLVDGQFRFRVSGSRGSRVYVRQMRRSTPGGRVYDPASAAPAAGSLMKHLTDTQAALCAAATPGGAAQRSRQANGGGATNSANMLLRDDVAGWSAVALSQFDAFVQAVSLLPIGAHHYLYMMGQAHGNVPSAGQRNLADDTQIRYSASALPTPHFRFLPANWRAYIPGLAAGRYRLPLWVNKWWAHDSSPQEFRWIQTVEGIDYGAWCNVIPPLNATRKTFCRSTLINGVDDIGVTGDSGSPVFLVINGSIVLYSSLSRQGGLGDRYGDLIATITQAMRDTAQEMGDPAWESYMPATVDLSGFNTYL